MADSREDRPLVKTDSRKRLERDDGRRNKFKERGKNIQRGVSSPALFAEGGKPKTGPKAPMPLNPQEAVTVGQSMGHEFVRKTYFQPTYCHHCTEMLWGLKGQGFQCSVCNFVSHERCIADLKVPCRHVMADMIQDPEAHKWTKPMTFKKKVYCNVCRKKISSPGVFCEVCRYYTHARCKNKAFNNCKHCATHTHGKEIVDTHHWIEGNLPSSARCWVCSKSCATTECLSGFKCGWCGISVHSGCLERVQQSHPTCTYRDLFHMILPPKSLTYRPSVNSDPASGTPVTPASGGDDDQAEEEDDAQDTDDKEDGKACLVVDGRGQDGFKRWRKATMHPTKLAKKLLASELLSISLRKCGISEDPSRYYLAEVIDSSKGEERELKPDEHPYDIPQKGHGLLKLYIRHKSEEEEEVDGPTGSLRINGSQIETKIQYVSVSLNPTTSVEEVLKEAIKQFSTQDSDVANYCLVEVSQIDGVKERIMDNKECPLQQILELRKDSVTLSNRQRYYIRRRGGAPAAIFLAMKKELLKNDQLYTRHVKKLISEAPQHLLPEDIPYNLIQFGPAFPTMGGLILEFPSLELAMRISAALEQSTSSPKIIMLPTIHPEFVTMNQEPLLVFVNGKSGGNQGVELLSAFRRHLNPHQVYDLANCGPIPGLYAFRHVQQFRILIGGGDGTFGWVLAALTEIKDSLVCKNPPSALLPLGTGNDLARALKWGAGYTGEKVMQVLLSVEDANVVQMDRWNVMFQNIHLPKGVGSSQEEWAKVTLEPHSVVMNNYLGIGLDAAIALDFHLAREENPEKFNSRFHNKGVYLQLGLQKMVSKGQVSKLHQHIRIFADDKLVDLPECEGIVFLNIQSWGAGADPWGTSPDTNYEPASFGDGLMEVVGITGVMQMGQIQSGVRCGIRIAQGKKFKVEFQSTVPVQVDGEAWPQPPGVMTIERLPEQATMLLCSDKAVYSRAISKKEESTKIALIQTISQPEILLSGGMSSRRGRFSNTTPPDQDALIKADQEEP